MSTDTMLASRTMRPIVVVGGKPYHYHEIDLEELEKPDDHAEWIKRLDHVRPVFRVSFPFHLTLKTYIAPAVGDRSIWLVRQWRAESYSRETLSGPRLKPARKRDRLIFENAIVSSPTDYEIRPRRLPTGGKDSEGGRRSADLRPTWARGSERGCQYMEDAPTPEHPHRQKPIVCPRLAAYAIMWRPAAQPAGEHFGYICEHHKADFEAFIRESQPNPEDYTLRRLH